MKRLDGETDAEFLARFAQAAEARADDDTDEWTLNRVPGESDEEYRERCSMLGCDAGGVIRLRRWKRD